MPVTSENVVSQQPDDPTETRLDTNDHDDIPLDELAQHVRPQSFARRLRADA